jgi:hypothetical protein
LSYRNVYKSELIRIDMKKVGGLLIAVVLLSIFMTGLVSAESSVERFLDRGVEQISPVAKYLVGDAENATVLFVKVLVLILLLVVVYIAIGRVPGLGDNGTIAFVVSLIVSLIAVRYITSEALVNLIWIPYGTLAIVLSAGLPFIIAFFFLESFDQDVVRKVGWIALLVVFVGLALMRWEELAVETALGNLAWIYVIIAVLCGLLFLYDKHIKAWIERRRLRLQAARTLVIGRAKKRAELVELRKDFGRATTPADRKAIRDAMKQLNVDIADLTAQIRTTKVPAP